MVKDLDLLSYLPPFLQEYRELQEIFAVEEPSLNQVNVYIDQLLQNQFISSCDVTGISVFENLLSIFPYSYDSLEARIERVLLKWRDYPPYTLRYLIGILDDLFGDKNYEFVEDFNNYCFGINFINNFAPSDFGVFYQFIDNIKPANLVCNLSRNSNHSCLSFYGVVLFGEYVQSKFFINDFSNDVSQISSNLDTFSSPIIYSNYVKEVFSFE